MRERERKKKTYKGNTSKHRQCRGQTDRQRQQISKYKRERKIRWGEAEIVQSVRV